MEPCAARCLSVTPPRVGLDPGIDQAYTDSGQLHSVTLGALRRARLKSGTHPMDHTTNLREP